MKKHKGAPETGKKHTVYPGTKLVRDEELKHALKKAKSTQPKKYISIDDVNSELTKTISGYKRENYLWLQKGKLSYIYDRSRMAQC